MSAMRDREPSSGVLAFFGAELRRLRSAAGLSQEDLGQRVCYSASLIGMVETARRVPTRDFAQRCDVALGCDGALTRLWPLVSREALPRWFRSYSEIERDAASIRSWEPLVVPGLMQTQDYARALFAAWQPGDGREAVEEQVAARLERQQLLDREDPPLMWMIIGEAALRNPVGGPQVLAGQLGRLLEVEADHPKVILQVVPIQAGAHPGLAGPLVLVSRPGEPDVAYLEVQDRQQMADRPEDVARYSLLYDVLRAVALSPDASREMIVGLAKGDQM